MPLDIKKEIGTEWTEFLDLKKSDDNELTQIGSDIEKFYQNTSQYECSPEESLIFASFKNCKPTNVKVVFVGNDPYLDKNKANGMCFSTKNSEMTTTITNLKRLLNSKNLNPDFLDYAKKGILFLNTSLTFIILKSKHDEYKNCEKCWKEKWDKYEREKEELEKELKKLETERKTGNEDTKVFCNIYNKELDDNKKQILKHEKNKPNLASYKEDTYKIWKPLIKRTLEKLNECHDIKFVFWGKEAKKLCEDLNMRKQGNVICVAHPSCDEDKSNDTIKNGYDDFVYPKTDEQKNLVNSVKEYFQ